VTHTPQPRAIIVGSGIAGLSAALHLGNCTVITKSFLGAGSTRLAQGGLAVALGPDDSPEQHVADTVAVSGGMGDQRVARQVAAGAIEGIGWLAELGAAFDMEKGNFQLGREAGHSLHRIVHANGDATGAEVIRALTTAVRERPDIEVLENTFALDAIIDGHRVVGLSVVGPDGATRALLAPAVVLATGGVGSVYSATTNPVEATGDGLAIAWRAGAAVRDCEFVQFHPTALATGSDPLPLLTEALRGAGGLLLNGEGQRFMTSVHDDAELAPRDVVARAIWEQMRTSSVFLDTRLVPDVEERFPTAVASARDLGLNIAEDLLPVTPAQHYFMGGVAVDQQGRSSVEGLYAVGEVSATGLHGANRLASNSLIEGLVFGEVVARSITRHARPVVRSAPSDIGDGARPTDPMPSEVELLRQAMWSGGGIVRTGDGLDEVATLVESWWPVLSDHPVARNLAITARLIVRAASRRRESRGAHFRADHPTTDRAQDQSVVERRSMAEPWSLV
jgi:L-aspartate oxidase